ncbi:TonB-dependent receptor [Sphingobium boeckii]|uniref:Iron complex outermembrane receptor protein n=1 Tax=Sphingobium boeckii TaxID=1082345 RepID=A0A7W9EEQ3_9SPHN|nr:TonB-dependent receptor [Sphingobium boeckii]MBB5684906.1 iron complex outermembrane receptor protein [Sphingobium boeckii]
MSIVSNRSRVLLAVGSSFLALLATPGVAETGPAANAGEEAAETAVTDGASSANDNEITVTARRRAERAQDVPIALTAVSGDTLERAGAINLVQIAQLTPTLVIRNNNARNTFVNIRGLGSNSDQNDGLEIGVGFYVDDVYYGRIGGSQFDLVDLDRVEVLRGPQGTLFGKNTTAGAINITTRAPSFDTEFAGEATYGSGGYHQVRGSFSGPLINDIAAVRITLSDTHRDGTLYNIYNDRKVNDYDNFSVRGQLLLTPTPNLNIRIIGDYSKQTSYSRAASVVGLFTKYANGATLTNNWLDRATRAGYTPRFDINDPFAREVDVNGPIQADMKGYGVSGKIDWDLGAVTLTSVTAWRGWDWLPDNDTDNTPLAITLRSGTDNHQRQFSQEFRVASNGDRKIDYVAGLYYFWQNVNALGHYQQGPDSALWNNPTANQTLANYALDGFLSYSVIEPVTKSYAAFGQATWHATDALSVTGGLRFTYEKKTGLFDQYTAAGNDLSLLSQADQSAAQKLRDAIYPEKRYTTGLKDDAVTGQITVAYDVADDVLAYATYSRGSKSGGLSLGDLPAGVSPVVKPEKINAWEVGVKSQFLDRKITLNAALYWTEVTDYQAGVTDYIGNTNSTIRYISNIPGVRSRGVEVDLAVAPTRNLRLTASAAYNDAVYKDYTNAQVAPESRNLTQVQDLSGVQLANAPKFIYSLAADFTQPLSLITPDDEAYLRFDFNHRSSNDTSGSNSIYTRISPYGLANARVGLRFQNQRYDLALWVTNVFDKEYFDSLSASNQGLITGGLGSERQFGATLRAQF